MRHRFRVHCTSPGAWAPRWGAPAHDGVLGVVFGAASTGSLLPRRPLPVPFAGTGFGSHRRACRQGSGTGKELTPVSVLTREISAAARFSPRHLTAGTFADPVRLTWREVHEQAKRMAGGLAARGIRRQGSVAVLATDAADIAPLAQAAWLSRAAVTMVQQPTPRTD